MTTQKATRRYIFPDAEAIAAERLRRRGLKRFLGSQATVAVALGLEALAEGAKAATDEEAAFPANADESVTAPAPETPPLSRVPTENAEATEDVRVSTEQAPGPEQQEDAATSRPAALQGAEPEAPTSASAASGGGSGGGGAGGGGSGSAGGASSSGGVVGSSTPPASPQIELPDLSQPPLVTVELDVDLPRIIDLSDGPSLVVAVDADLPLLPDLGIAVSALGPGGDQIRVEAELGGLGVEVAAGLPLLGENGLMQTLSPIVAPLASATKPVLSGASEAVTPVADLLAGAGDIAGGETIRLLDTLGEPIAHPLFAGTAHTAYGMEMAGDGQEETGLAAPVTGTVTEVLDLSAIEQMNDTGAPNSSALSLLGH